MKISNILKVITNADRLDTSLASPATSERVADLQPLRSSLDKLGGLNILANRRSTAHQAEHLLRKELVLPRPQPDKIRALIEQGANPKATSTKQANNALHALARANRLSALEAQRIIEQLGIREPLDFNRQNKDGDTPLHIAVREQSAAYSTFFQHNPDVTQRNNAGESILSIAQKQYLEAKRTALFSYSKTQLRDEHSSKAVLKDYHTAKEILRWAQRAIATEPEANTPATQQQVKAQTRKVRFAETASTQLIEERQEDLLPPLHERLETAQSTIEKQDMRIKQLECQLETLATEYRQRFLRKDRPTL